MNVLLLFILSMTIFVGSNVTNEPASPPKPTSPPGKVNLNQLPPNVNKAEAKIVLEAFKSAEIEKIEKDFAETKDAQKKQQEMQAMSSVSADWQKTIDAMPK